MFCVGSRENLKEELMGPLDFPQQIYYKKDLNQLQINNFKPSQYISQ